MLAIRREDQSVWERRAPFNPTHVKKLIKQGVKVIVQPSNRRSYPMQVRFDNIGYAINLFANSTTRDYNHTLKCSLKNPVPQSQNILFAKNQNHI